RDCWCGTPSAFEGDQVSVRDRIMLFPTPAQAAGVPVLVGGMSNAALRRAAEHGNGWVAMTFAERLDVAVLGERLESVRSLRAQAGIAPFELVLKIHGDPPEPDGMPEAVAAVAGLGFNEIVVDLPWEQGSDKAC